MLIRRRDPVFTEWTGKGRHYLSPADGRSTIATGPGITRILERASDWVDPGEVADAVSDGDADRTKRARAAIETLLRCGLLVTDERDAAPWDGWGGVAELFHRHTRDAPYVTDLGRKRQLIDELAGAGAPPTSKRYPAARRVFLPRGVGAPRADFLDVLLTRRTHRQFTDRPVTLEELATLLQLTFGPQRFVDGQVFGTLQLRTSPNAGSRHEVECYVAALAVDDLPPGLYHYDGLQHCLEELRPGPLRAELKHVMAEQPMADTTPVVCLTTAVTERIAHKYRDGRAYRLWMYNVGHVGQTFALVATALGLGAFQTAAFRDSDADALLGLTDDTEFTTYILGCGAVEDPHRPPDIAPPPPRQAAR